MMKMTIAAMKMAATQHFKIVIFSATMAFPASASISAEVESVSLLDTLLELWLFESSWFWSMCAVIAMATL